MEKLFTLSEVCNIFLDAWDTGYKAACQPDRDNFTAEQAWNSYVNSSRIAKLTESAKEKPTVSDPNSSKPEELTCPECSSKMVARTNRQSGEKFWGCTRFPQCKGTRDSLGKSKYDRDIDKEIEKAGGAYPHQEGYRFKKG